LNVDGNLGPRSGEAFRGWLNQEHEAVPHEGEWDAPESIAALQRILNKWRTSNITTSTEDRETRRLARLRRIFEKADKDGSGSLDDREIRHVVAKAFKNKNVEFDTTLIRKYTELQMNKFDADHTGSINFDEFARLYKSLLEDPELPIQLRRKADQADVDYLALEGENAPPRARPAQADEFSEEERALAIDLFHKCDVDGSGKIDAHELKSLLKTHMPKAKEMIINRFVEANINLGDKDDDQLIDEQEFMKIFKKLYQENRSWFSNTKN